MLPRRVLVVGTVLVLGLACGVRLTALDTWPPPNGSAFEEAQLGQQAHQAMRGELPNEHLLAILAPALSFKIFGMSMTTLRLPFIVIGLLIPFFVFGVCRRMVSWEVALFATALLAVSWWSVTSARIADEIFFPAWLVPLVLWCLVNFTETARPSSAFGLAIFSSLVTYEYTGYHLVPFLLVAYLFAASVYRSYAWIMSESRPPFLATLGEAIRKWSPGLLVIAVVWADVAMHRIVGDLVQGGHMFIEGFARHQGSGCGLGKVLVENLPEYTARRLGEAVHTAFDPDGGAELLQIGFKGYPLFDLASAWSCLVAGGLVVISLYRRYHAFVLAWIAGVVLVATLFPCAVNGHRLYTILPLMYVLIALGFQVLWDLLSLRALRMSLVVLFLVVIGYSANWNLRHLWVHYVQGKSTLPEFEEIPTRISLWISKLEPDALIWLLAEEYEYLGQPNDYYWLLNGRQAVTADSIPDVLPSPKMPTGPLYYLSIAKAEQSGLRDLIQHYYPKAEQLDSTPIAIRGLDVQVFRIDPKTSPEAWVKPPSQLSGFLASYASSRNASGPDGPELPPDARLLMERHESFLSELSIPLGLKKRYRDLSHDGNFLWCTWKGEIDGAGASEAAFRLYVRGGEAWLSVNDGPPVRAAAPPGQALSVPFTARLSPGKSSFRLCYRFGPGEIVGVQLYRTMSGGTEKVLTVPFDSPTVVSLMGLEPELGPAGNRPPAVRVEEYNLEEARYRGGLSIRAPSELTYALPEGAVELHSLVHLHDGYRGCAEASIYFSVLDENRNVLAESGRIDPNRTQTSIRVDLRGHRSMSLVVDDGGDGNNCDSGYWGNPVLLLDRRTNP